MAELTLDAIQMLLQSSRGRGEYEDVLREFIDSDVPGIEVDLTTGPLTGKDPKNVATGFKNVQGRNDKTTGQPVVPGSHLVKVILRTVKNGDQEEGHVFLINTAKLGQGDGSANTDAAEPAATAS